MISIWQSSNKQVLKLAKWACQLNNQGKNREKANRIWKVASKLHVRYERYLDETERV